MSFIIIIKGPCTRSAIIIRIYCYTHCTIYTLYFFLLLELLLIVDHSPFHSVDRISNLWRLRPCRINCKNTWYDFLWLWTCSIEFFGMWFNSILYSCGAVNAQVQCVIWETVGKSRKTHVIGIKVHSQLIDSFLTRLPIIL